MPEISARDLRRLQALQERLTKTQDERKALSAERRELRAAVNANARRARAAEKEAAAAEDKVEAVLRENAALAARIDEIQADLGRVEAASVEQSFVENAWIGHTLAIGGEVRLSVTGPCPRCVMTTLPQGDLPRDPGILRTAAQHNLVNVGVYAAVVRGGTIRRGDAVRLGT